MPVTPIKVKKSILKKNGWYIQKKADWYEKSKNPDIRPYTIAYCTRCKQQRFLLYIGQTKEEFVFECAKCLEEDYV